MVYEEFGYVLIRGNRLVPVSPQARPILDSFDGLTTLRQIQECFGQESLNFGLTVQEGVGGIGVESSSPHHGRCITFPLIFLGLVELHILSPPIHLAPSGGAPEPLAPARCSRVLPKKKRPPGPTVTAPSACTEGFSSPILSCNSGMLSFIRLITQI